jgi:GNAT superfamily N-acetyltransferase
MPSTEATDVHFSLRIATLDDCASIDKLIARSIRSLGAGDYTSEQIEHALTGAFGLDTQLIMDQTYFIAMSEGRIAGCGGWSKRKTLFGSDARSGRDAGLLEPGKDAAKIRAFFVDPDFARRGIGAALLNRCEEEASRAGYTKYEMMATLPGVRLYAAYGYTPSQSIQHPLTSTLSIEFVPMHKQGP